MFILNKDKNKNFLECNGNALKRMKLISTEDSKDRNQNVTEASYFEALEIAKQKKTYNWGKFDQALLSENSGNCF